MRLTSENRGEYEEARRELAVATKVNKPVLLIRIRIHMFFGLRDPDPLVRGMDPEPNPALDPDPYPSIIKQI